MSCCVLVKEILQEIVRVRSFEVCAFLLPKQVVLTPTGEGERYSCFLLCRDHVI